MPAALQRYCAQLGCPNKVTKGRCPACTTQHNRARGSAASRLYGYRWQMRSQAFLRRHPLCGDRPDGRLPVMSWCAQEGRVTQATQVDHVVPHKMDLERFWNELGNWQALCGRCHGAKSQAGQ